MTSEKVGGYGLHITIFKCFVDLLINVLCFWLNTVQLPAVTYFFVQPGCVVTVLKFKITLYGIPLIVLKPHQQHRPPYSPA